MRGKKNKQPASLWEVMNRDRLKKSQEKVKKQMAPQDEVKQEQQKPQKPAPKQIFENFKRKTAFRVTKPMVLTAILIIVVILGVLFSIGGEDASPEFSGVQLPANIEDDQPSVFPPLDTADRKNDQNNRQNSKAAKDEKDHIIVIASYNVANDLEPVKKYFASKGIETEITKPKDSIFYLLVTRKKYESPLREGTDGYYALEKIKKIGSNYDAPKGYEPFGKAPFQDAYGMKVKNN